MRAILSHSWAHIIIKHSNCTYINRLCALVAKLKSSFAIPKETVFPISSVIIYNSQDADQLNISKTVLVNNYLKMVGFDWVP